MGRVLVVEREAAILGSAAAALPGKAMKPTPRAAAETTSAAIRLLVRMYGSPPCRARGTRSGGREHRPGDRP